MHAQPADEKWVRVMADYGSDGLWHRKGCMMALSSLPISDSLKARHAAWCAWYEDCGDLDDDAEDADGTFDRAAFATEGRQIAEAIKAELPDWTVIYLDESRRRFTLAECQPRAEFEYEVL